MNSIDNRKQCSAYFFNIKCFLAQSQFTCLGSESKAIVCNSSNYKLLIFAAKRTALADEIKEKYPNSIPVSTNSKKSGAMLLNCIVCCLLMNIFLSGDH